MANRKLIIEQPNGQLLRGEIGLSDMPNADARAPFTAIILEQCRHCEQWHEVNRAPLPNWSDA